MLIETQYKNGKLIISYVDNSGQIKLKYYDWEKPTKYEVCSHDDPLKHPTYKSWDGKSVKLVEISYPDRYAIYEFLDALPQEEQDEIFAFNLPEMYFVDIETKIVDGFPEAADIYDKNGNLTKEGASTPILAISVVYDDKVILLGTEELSQMMKDRIVKNTNEYFKQINSVDYKFKFIHYEDEFDMIYHFFHKMVPKMPLITGWNFKNYDWVYLVNRSRKLTKNVNGKQYTIDPRVSSFTYRLTKKWGAEWEEPAHRMIFDYMQLYTIADTSIKVKESSSLDFVSDKLVGINKIKYVNSIFKLNEDRIIRGIQFKKDDILRPDEDNYYIYNGLERLDFTREEFNSIKEYFREINVTNLQDLYDEDIEIYMYYNAVDSVLVQKIHEARDYISIIFAISSLAKIKVVDVISDMNNALASLAITEGVLRNRFREQENIVLFKDKTKKLSEADESGITGGWVKEPEIGMNEWVVCYDFASLYPTTQRQYFIAPENFIGIEDEHNKGYCRNGVKIEGDKHVVCSNGVVFLKRKSPTIKMLEDVYADRKADKKIMNAKLLELDDINHEIEKLKREIELEEAA